MVDREGRDRLAELLHQFVAARLTNDQFVENQPASSDPAVVEIENASWYLYDDTHEHKLIGRFTLDPKDRTEIAQWIMFLKTDLPYEWPVVPAWKRLLLVLPNLLTLGLVGRLQRRWFSKHGDVKVWPFIRKKDFENARRSPKYLSGVA